MDHELGQAATVSSGTVEMQTLVSRPALGGRA
jgi:hypothetical protein